MEATEMNGLRFLILCFAVLLWCADAATFTNPLKTPNGSDPFIVYTGGYYYLVTTTWDNLQITRSTTLGGLKTASPKIVWTDRTSSRTSHFWAPELHWLDNKWWLYYTAGTPTCCDNQRSHVLVGSSTDIWASTWSYSGRLSAEWGIDSTILRMPTGDYFVWSRFSPAGRQSLYIAKLNSPTSIGTPWLLSEPTRDWEAVGGAVNEGPTPIYHGGKVFLAFSASYCWGEKYQLGLLTYQGSGDPLLASSWTKTGPHFSSANGNYGTGHNAFFLSPDTTEWWNVYHATSNPNGACDGSRYTAAQKVNWKADGTPDFGRAEPLGKVLVGPSGEPA